MALCYCLNILGISYHLYKDSDNLIIHVFEICTNCFCNARTGDVPLIAFILEKAINERDNQIRSTIMEYESIIVEHKNDVRSIKKCGHVKNATNNLFFVCVMVQAD